MIEVRNLSKIFKSGGGVNDISFSFQEGDIVGLIGDNGAGKSTIIKTIFNEYNKNSGEIFIDNLPITKESYKKMSFFPDQSIYPNNISIEDYCVYSGMLAGVSKKDCKIRTEKLLKFLSLEAYAKKKFKILSAGMQKRAMLAITMISNPDIIILDEPTANLDVTTRFEFMDYLRQLAGNKKTILITSHIINELQGLVNKIIVIDKGKKIFENYLKPGDEILKIYKDATEKALLGQSQSKDINDIFG
ncbi:ABC transporter ATP-binding protein [Spiroplasma chinense]|uniref:ABC transporter ATP-binding protein n=1 Tax=Spiroplasma chinense TaxID=216932 RepID=A0A5B9Y5J0_9MOLU|nr:ABC transporter ATP-binding protein [Spiroplasma chinense]QEH61292.1 ABC transporter ATP-binding protein [Spiroplasma chinense]